MSIVRVVCSTEQHKGLCSSRFFRKRHPALAVILQSNNFHPDPVLEYS